jgi:hypothetical protein
MLVDQMRNKIILFLSVISWWAAAICFAQSDERSLTPPNGSVTIATEPKLSAEKLSAQDRFDEVLSASLSLCGQRYPYPVVSNKNPYEEKDSQLCRRLELTGKRIECEINYMGAQYAKGGVFGPESFPALKEWASCTGKVSVLLEEGYYIPVAEISRRLQFCVFQFYKHPGEVPKLSLMDRMTKGFFRPDYRASSSTTIAASIFDKSSIRIDDQKAGLLQCQYMMPQESSRQSVKTDTTETPPPLATFREEKQIISPVTKSPTKKATPEVIKVPSPVVKKPDSKALPPVGECRRPKHDCPK